MIIELSDKELMERCERFGREALLWRNKFRALLPEVDRRKLWAKKGYGSIFEFGKRLAGLSDAQVAESLNIVSRLEDKPMLRGLLESGEVSVNKIIRVMPIATIENEGELAEKVQLLSVGAIKTLVRDVKLNSSSKRDSCWSLDVPKPESNLLFEQELHLDEDVRKKLVELEQKGININELLRKALHEREKEIIQAKEQVAESLPEHSSRYIPARVKNILEKEYGTKCAKIGCNRPSREIHHTARFGVTQSHDPNFMAPLCKEHHQIAHAIDVRVSEKRFR